MNPFLWSKNTRVLLVLLVCSAPPAFLAQDQTNPGYISIDCGAANAYTDENLAIYYTPDAEFVESGENRQLIGEQATQVQWNQSTTLRTFPNGTRNCYTLKPDQGKHNAYLIRASFQYGNYDNKQSIPSFDLYIDANKWTTVNPTDNLYEEIIYTPTRDYVQVCLVNIGLGVPFISTLELRPLSNSTYSSGSLALKKWTRLNVGSTTSYIRHPQDEYDRIWEGKIFPSFSNLTSSSTSINPRGNNEPYKVPVEVLMTAQTTINISYTMSLWWLSNLTDIWYIYFHFMEIETLLAGQSRQFQITIQDTNFTTVTPKYLDPVTEPAANITGHNTINISISATSQANVPPFLNAIEIYNAIDLPNYQTDLNDVNAIIEIKTMYKLVKLSWQGDPCVPEEFVWNGLVCNQDIFPRIVSLNLSSNNLIGSIATSFFNLSALVSLDLSFNKITGELPEFFADMPNLRFLNLTGNNLNGTIPAPVKEKMKNNTLYISLDGNPEFCQNNHCTPSTPPSSEKKILLPLVASICSLVVVVLLACIFAILWRRRKTTDIVNDSRSREVIESTGPKAVSGFENGIGSSEESRLAVYGPQKISRNHIYTCDEVIIITESLKTVIGKGGCGKVYLGTLDDGKNVAVKMLLHTSKQGYKELQAEAQVLMLVHHKNLVSLVGYSEEFETMALIYEFMPNGDLSQHLKGNNGNVLSWSQRLQIATDAAEGLEYLHYSCGPPIIHGDLKTSNILLDENMQAKIADFGLSSRAVVDSATNQISTHPAAGTPGYIDPIFNAGGNLNHKSDVYSFGIILLELITGQSAIIRSQKDSAHIVKWVTPLIDVGDIDRILDPSICGQFNPSSAWKAVEIALKCVQMIPMQRPNISRVLLELRDCISIQINYQGSQGMEVSNQIYTNSFKMTSFEIDR